ncbi:phage virion morphogenesis protein [Pseudomonas sp. GX19020]|uniref:phage virion morphogenesis protein n=1 Tax=Pseudomonas sp. GX19020 TaxID=2942277 RepID=UPI002019E546|nr:phage virion morphogenesis protein [Pseudomonas sp. GX19020]MCL4065925.1 phage virion morphogenesis protein [Pseudomonas sp. GX19020]
MTGVQYHVDFKDLGIAEGFEAIADGAEDLTDLMDLVGSVLVNGAIERISSSNVSPDGVAWPQSLRAKEDGGRTLHESGLLMRSITSHAAPREVMVGSNMIYAGVHQAGATIKAKTAKGLSFTLANGDSVVVGSVTIPARPYLGISEAEQATIQDVTAIFVDDLLGGRSRSSARGG